MTSLLRKVFKCLFTGRGCPDRSRTGTSMPNVCTYFVRRVPEKMDLSSDGQMTLNLERFG
jgi:hypothetical protein